MSIYLLLEEPKTDKPEYTKKILMLQVGVIIKTIQQISPNVYDDEIQALGLPAYSHDFDHRFSSALIA